MQKTRDTFSMSLRKADFDSVVMAKRMKVIQGNHSQRKYTEKDLRENCEELDNYLNTSQHHKGRSLLKDVEDIVSKLKDITMQMDNNMTQSTLDLFFSFKVFDNLRQLLSPIHEPNFNIQSETVWIFLNCFTAPDTNDRLHKSGVIYSLMLLLDATKNIELASLILWTLRNAMVGNVETREDCIRHDLWGLLHTKSKQFEINDDGGSNEKQRLIAFRDYAYEIVKLINTFYSVKPFIGVKVVVSI